MINLSYTLNNELQSLLEQANLCRQKILLTPLSPKSELQLRWEASVDRLFYGARRAGFEVTKNQIISALTSNQKNNTREIKWINHYKQALDYIYVEWIATDKTVSIKHISELYELISGRVTSKKEPQFRQAEKYIEYFLDYLQRYPEKPIIQAAITQIQIIDIKPFNDYIIELSQLMALIFLYKWGFDMRGFLCLEQYWYQNRLSYDEIVINVSQKGRLTLWLEFFSHGLLVQLQKVSKQVEEMSFDKKRINSFLNLNERQKEILTYLEAPFSKITNRQTQRLFSVSQITASRDLNRLVSFGLLFSHGKGRSVYYTRV